jgi:hypothetical protein
MSTAERASGFLARPSGDLLWWGLPLAAGFATNALPISPTAAPLVWAAAFAWMTALAAAAVMSAWLWTGLQILRTRRRPARSTLLSFGSATTLLALAIAWPSLEPIVVNWLKG